MSHHHLKEASESQIKKYAHYLSAGEKMLYFTGLANTYLLRKFCIRFLFPGIILIVAITGGGVALGYPLVYSLLAGYFAAGLVAGVMNYFNAKGTQYILTNRRLIMQLGYFNVSLTSAVYDKITHVEVRQNFIEMSLYKFGTVVIHTAGSQQRAIVLDHIAHPIQFKNILEHLVDKVQHPHSSEHTSNTSHSPKWKRVGRKRLKKLSIPV